MSSGDDSLLTVPFDEISGVKIRYENSYRTPSRVERKCEGLIELVHGDGTAIIVRDEDVLFVIRRAPK